jgi:D-alanyl-D-alanine carboxypeptidase
MKLIIYYLLIPFICLFISTYVLADVKTVYFVSPLGNDNNPGTIELPFATILKARNVVRTINGNLKGDVIINLRGGTYEQTSTFTLTAINSGTNGFNIIYKAYNCETPVISGGIKIIGWTLHDVSKNIYQAKVDTSLNTRQLYVNGLRAIRARSKDATGWLESGDGYNCPKIVESWDNITNVEIVSHIKWKSHRGSIASLNGTHVVMDQPY